MKYVTRYVLCNGLSFVSFCLAGTCKRSVFLSALLVHVMTNIGCMSSSTPALHPYHQGGRLHDSWRVEWVVQVQPGGTGRQGRSRVGAVMCVVVVICDVRADCDLYCMQVVKCSCVVVKNWGEDTEARHVIMEHIKN